MCLRGLTQLHKYPGVPAACPEELEALRRVAGTRCSARTRRCTRPPACLCQVFPLYIAVIVQHAIFSAAATELSNTTDEAALLARPVHRDALANLRHALAARLLQGRLGCSRWRRLAHGLIGLHVLLVGTGHRVRPPMGVAGHHEPLAEAPVHPGCCTTQGCFSDAKWAVLASLG